MKILILSDSHGDVESLAKIKNQYVHSVDMMIHCGDSELDAQSEVMEGFKAVRGNCDYDGRYPKETIEKCGGITFYATHGHLHSVKTTLMNLYYRAKEVEANVVCFGHSHILGVEMIEGILFINPGSILLPRKRIEKTYVLLEVENDKAIVKIFEVDGTELVELEREFTLPLS
ncbi:MULTISPECIES: metallophosphoesterase [unclassified Bacillus (in: firmicutes)]|uniref:metallophosphoesterase n=1 Tax=unclassified Bacillus (in: firmicutes) TaxID=185979 RepID=UPI0008E42913|nr:MULTISPECIES: metallophosphoesterase [unclassified Bacillus (in: firmicutes)]SFB16647.1 hypothetical protein SAMN02799634_10759 [Bacillus sp. UNCCL13]SFQ77918.1 hypothetical protein SAMN04488577_1580 [Bacillus sp. cl95]